MAEYKHQLLYWYLFSFFVFFCVLHHIQIHMGTQIAQKNTIKIAQRAGCGFSRIPHAAAPFVPKGSLCCQSLVAFFFERAGCWVMGWLLAAFRRGRGCICSSLQRNLPGWGAEGGAEVSRRSLERRAAQPCHPGGKRMRLMRGRSSPPTIRRGVALVCLGAEAGFRSRVGVGCGVRVV